MGHQRRSDGPTPSPRPRHSPSRGEKHVVSVVFTRVITLKSHYMQKCIFFSWFQEEARRHFNCPILEGMELENQGGTGTELNHWEKRLLEVNTHVSVSLSVGL